MAALAVCAAVACIGPAHASAASCPLRATVCLPFPRLDFKLGAHVLPRALPVGKPAPVGVRIDGHVRHRDGTHPSALREMVLNVDKDVEVDFRGLPVCQPGLRLAIRRPPGYLRRICREAIVGTGEAKVEIAFAEQRPIPQSSRITAFNGGMRGGGGRLLVHAFNSVPVPAAIVATVDLKPWMQGWRAVVKVPRIVGGAGSLTSFRLNLKRFFRYRGERRSFLSARCPDGRFKVSIPKIRFENETNAPGIAPRTILRGGLLVPCKVRE